jgi:hypothetical protein
MKDHAKHVPIYAGLIFFLEADSAIAHIQPKVALPISSPSLPPSHSYIRSDLIVYLIPALTVSPE